MTALASAFAEQTTLQSTTNTSYEDVSGAAIASGSFTAGKKYLLIFGQAVGSSSSTALTSIQAVHGTTAFAESEAIIRPNGSGLFIQNAWWTIWEAVSSEGIKNQFKTSASTGRADNMVLIAVVTIESSFARSA